MLYLCYLCRFKPLRDHLRGFLIAAWAGDKIAEFSFPEISFHFPLRPWFFFVSPAYAGKRACTPCCTPVCGDHPRVCGEKFCFVLSLYNLLGSPPRMRGKGRRHLGPQLLHGITPACAGKRILTIALPPQCWDHPRVCGEKNSASVIRNCKQGSPPRMRGKVHFHPVCPAACRITPAYAGKSRIRRACTDRHRDHPRMCGEKGTTDILKPGGLGSPPHVRGKVALIVFVQTAVGITPACAGKRCRLPCLRCPDWDHPRMCGEKTKKIP